MERPIDEFADEEFIALNQPHFDKYVEMRVHGHSAQTSFMRIFGAAHWPGPQQGHVRLDAIESTEYFKNQFAKRLEEVKIHELWDTKKSLHELLNLVRGDYIKDATRLAAAKELNVLVGITIVDENGKTKAGRSLADFYANQEVKAPQQPA